MAKRKSKDWTILNYANGNNEYEPDMYNALLDSQKIGSSDNINVVMEIGRCDRETARIIRASETLAAAEDNWTGVRRYYISEKNSTLISDLGNINMSHPKALYNFIKWGIEKYPAKHYILILGGHGASFVGTMTDYSQSSPYIMGTAEMCKAINMINKVTGYKIDILILDICYMNLVEIIYELGRNNKNTVENVITYIESGPVSGIPCDRLIETVEKNSNIDKPYIMSSQIIDNFNLNMVGIEVDHTKLKNIKDASNSLAYSYLSNKNLKKLSPFQLITDLNEEYPWNKNVLELQGSLSSIVFHYKEAYKSNGNLINIMFQPLGDLIKVYYKLSFSRDNYWTYLINNRELTDTLDIQIKEGFEPIKIRPDGLQSLVQVMNPSFNKEEIENVLKKLMKHKNWALK